MKTILWGSIFSMILSVLFLTFFSGKANAIPAFARKYKTSCMLCHAPFPRLTAMGNAFRLNGYKLPEADEIYVKEQPVSMGAEAYKMVFPNAVWPSTIPGMPPLAIRIIGNVQYHPYGRQYADNRSEFNFPDEFTLLGAGSLGENFAFFANLGFEKDDDYSASPRAWLMWQNLLSGTIGKHYLNIKAGNVGRHTIALPNARNENSFTLEDYMYVEQLDFDNEPGFQADGYGRHWRYGVGVVDGDPTNSQKDIYAAFSLKFGGLGYDGTGGPSRAGGVGTTPTGYWRDDSVHLGFFASRSYLDYNAYRFDRVGGDVRVNYQNFSVAAGYITGDNHETHEKKDIWFAEGYYFVFPWMIPYARYENMTVEHPVPQDGDLARFILGTAMLVRANVRVNLEGRIYTKNDAAKPVGGQVKDDDQIALVLDWAF